MLNTAIIMGRLTADPELRTTNTGLSVTTFTVAVDRGYVRPGEQRQADFINCVAWRQTAEFITKYFQKGSMIAVQGSNPLLRRPQRQQTLCYRNRGIQCQLLRFQSRIRHHGRRKSYPPAGACFVQHRHCR